jgi:ParB-like chromosome segregation protein Spo0J
MAKKGKKKNDLTPQITTAKVNDLLPYANNAREHTDEQVAQVAASIQEFGWTNPIITHGQTVVAGHARLAAARKLNLKEVPVIDRSDMSEAQWKAYVLADNQLAQNATWNEGLLTLELDALAELDFNLDLLGFGDLDALMGNDEPEEGLTDPDEIPDAPEEAITQPGDLWILGEHRLLCGDSTDAESVAYLMDGAKAALVHADPPYGMGKENDGVQNDNLVEGCTPERRGQRQRIHLGQLSRLVAAVVSGWVVRFRTVDDAERHYMEQIRRERKANDDRAAAQLREIP